MLKLGPPFNGIGLSSRLFKRSRLKRMFRGLERGMCWSVGSLFFPLSGLPFPLEAHLSGVPTGAFRAERLCCERACQWVAWTTDVLKLASSTYEKGWGGGERHI